MGPKLYRAQSENGHQIRTVALTTHITVVLGVVGLSIGLCTTLGSYATGVTRERAAWQAEITKDREAILEKIANHETRLKGIEDTRYRPEDATPLWLELAKKADRANVMSKEESGRRFDSLEKKMERLLERKNGTGG